MSLLHSKDITGKRCLIVNADDFGESEEVTSGIIEAHRNGIVTSTSLLANMPGFEHAVTLALKHPTLHIGAHLNMYRGPSLTECPYLAENGKFLHDTSAFITRSYRDIRTAREEVLQEFDAQIQKIRKAGINISHLDTEKHLHTLPFMYEILIALGKKYDIPAVRLPYEPLTPRALTNPTQLHKVLIMAFFALRNKRVRRASAIKNTDFFYGVTLSKRFSEKNLMEFFKTLPEGVTELSCHPGYDTGQSVNYIDAFRKSELRVLCSEEIRNAVTKNGIVLSNFTELL